MERMPAYLLLGMVILLPLSARAADQCDGLQTVQEVYQGVESKDRPTSLKAESCGLLSPDRAARGLVIGKYLQDGKSINVMVDINPGDKDAAEYLSKLPLFSIGNVQWSPNGHSFTGSTYGRPVSGNLIEDKLTISYFDWPLQNDKGEAANSQCSASLALNDKGTAMEGPLRCSGHSFRFVARLGF